MRSTLIAISFLVCPLAIAGNPPQPNLLEPVDYLAWVNEKFGDETKKNAAEAYAKAVDVYVRSYKSIETVRKTYMGEWDEEATKALRAWVAENERALQEWHFAAQINFCYLPRASEKGTLYDALPPHLKRLRGLVDVAEARVRLRFRDGDATGALDDILTILRTSRHLQEQPSVYEHLWGLKMTRTAYHALLDAPRLAGDSLDAADLLARLKKLDRSPPSPRRFLEGEQAFFRDFSQRLCEDSDGDGLLDIVNDPVSATRTIETPVSLADLNQAFDQCIKTLGQLYRSNHAKHDSVLRDLDDQLDALGAVGKTWSSGLSAMKQVDKQRRRRDAYRAGARVVLRMHAYKAAHDSWPADLATAMKGEPSKLSRDPYSGADLIYRIENGEPTLYSVGENGKDDGGSRLQGDRFGEEGDLVFWPREIKPKEKEGPPPPVFRG